MAGNDWINSYLEAILDVGPGIGDAKSSLLLRERGHFSPTRYFVEEVITGFDETDLHRAWVRAAATRGPRERNTRLENMCWRIWNLARKKKQLEGEEAQRKAKRRLEHERGRKEATADMSEDLSEGEKGDLPGDVSAHGDSTKGRMPRISSVDVMEYLANQLKEKKLYIVLISLHGLIRGENMELGRDSDTGGQVKYVVELARALGTMPGVYRVDLLTRQVSAPDVDWSYAEPTEMLSPRTKETSMQELGESSGAYIIRIPFGPKDKYIPKELLWPHIPEFVDHALSHIRQMSKVLGEQIGGGQPVWPVAIHGHYADAGDSAALLSGVLNVPMLFTGHSLGRDKLEQLLKQGRQSREEINTTYKIMRRIEAEELSLDASEIVITSTRQEIEEQWRLYDGFDPVLERKLRARIKRGVSCHGRFMPRMVGVFINPAFIEPFGLTLIEAAAHGLPVVATKNGGPVDIHRVLDNGLLVDPHDQQSIADALLKLVSDKQLWARCRHNGLKNIHLFSWPEHCKTYLSRIAMCKPRQPQWQRSDVEFENPERNSPGDSLRDIQDLSLNLKLSLDGEKSEGAGNGTLDNSLDIDDSVDRKSKLENAVLKLSKGATGGVEKASLMEKADQNVVGSGFPAMRMRKYIFVIAVDCDSVSDTSKIIRTIMEAAGKENPVGFILSTSLSISEVHSLLISGSISPLDFDAFICNSGSDVYYPISSSSEEGPALPFVVDLDYQSHIEYRWGGEGLRKTLVRWATSVNEKKGQTVAEDESRSTAHCYAFKVKDFELVPPIKELRKLMRIQALRCHVVYCQNSTTLNVIPVLASRAQALRYLYIRWGMELSNVIVFAGECGDTDYEGLLGGVHKTVILKGIGNNALKLHSNRSYPLEHVLSFDSPNILQAEGCCNEDVRVSLRKLGVIKE
ncbi:probable sucrose-phosphate synthase 1 isoform X3 [Durio zibethinus]|uniref:sucrose-phosphate synthase n=1 Tax=Durio zibethinus TaxID=66656 RepID=A0A6P5ZCT6_DURZI|nr:probable sucrose-phosphate synthase 1 isoform X3 [Durio zibethinus]